MRQINKATSFVQSDRMLKDLPKSVNKTVDGNNKPQQMMIDKKLALNQRAIESRGHIRLTSHKVSSKSSYSCSQKR